MSKRRSLFALVTAALAVLTIALTGGPAQAAGFTPINVWKSSHCLDDDTTDFSRLQMWSCTGGAEQRWLEGFNTQTGLFTFTNQNTGLCITAPASGAGAIFMAFCDAADTSQQWSVYFADNPLGLVRRLAERLKRAVPDDAQRGQPHPSAGGRLRSLPPERQVAPAVAAAAPGPGAPTVSIPCEGTSGFTPGPRCLRVLRCWPSLWFTRLGSWLHVIGCDLCG